MAWKNRPVPALDEPSGLFTPAARSRKPAPYGFVLEELAGLEVTTRWMFGCLALYVGDRVTLVLRDRPQHPEDNGVWLATSPAHHASLRALLPSLRSIALFGGTVSDWQVLPADGADFEDEALRACALVRAGDPRVGRVPKARRRALKAPSAASVAPDASAPPGAGASRRAKSPRVGKKPR
jgi:hypothetical protein